MGVRGFFQIIEKCSYPPKKRFKIFSNTPKDFQKCSSLTSLTLIKMEAPYNQFFLSILSNQFKSYKNRFHITKIMWNVFLITNMISAFLFWITFASAGTKPTFILFHLGKELHNMVAHLDAVTSLSIDPSGLYVLSGSKIFLLFFFSLYQLSHQKWKNEKKINDPGYPGYIIKDI